MSQELLRNIEPLRREAEKWLAANLDSRVELVKHISDYIVNSGGKRLRPILFMLAARMCGRDDPGDARYSSMFEYLHCGTLLHDDVIDEAETRRGHQAAHHRWGNTAVVLAGDYLLAKSLVVASETGQARIVDALAVCTGRLAEGQALELEYQHNLETPYEVYLDIITAKTAVLLAVACRIGAMHANASPEWEQALHDFGTELGIAFQMVDDWLDWAGDEKTLGKPTGLDLIEGKATLPWIQAREQADPDLRAKLMETAATGKSGAFSPEDWAWLRETVGRLGGMDQALKTAEDLKEKAKARLAVFPDSPAKTIMLQAADYVCRRRV